jgi:hypothetical protein
MEGTRKIGRQREGWRDEDGNNLFTVRKRNRQRLCGMDKCCIER